MLDLGMQALVNFTVPKETSHQTTEKTSSMFGGGGFVGGGQHHGIELLKIKSALAMPARCCYLLALR